MRTLLFSSILGVIFVLPVARAETLCSFKGTVDLVNKELQLEVDFKPKERIIGSLKLAGDAIFINSQVEHLKIYGSDLTTNLEGSLSLKRDKEGRIQDVKGFMWTRYTLLNYKPSKEMVGSFYIRDGKLHLELLTWAEMGFSGWVNLAYPYDMDIQVEIAEKDINELAPLLKVGLENLYLSGLVSGQIRFLGQLKRLQIKGRLHSNSGQIQDFIYRDCLINFSGYYPVLNIEDSSISDEQRLIYSLSGRLNLQEINNFTSSQHNIVVSPFSERGMDLRSLAIRKRKDLGRDSQIEFGYRLRPDRPSDSLSGSSEGMLGIEHRHKF